MKKFYNSIETKPEDDDIVKYLSTDSDNYCFKLKREDIEKELTNIGYVMFKYYKRYTNDEIIKEKEEYLILKRVFFEQFHVEENDGKVHPKESNELKSSFVQSPHDASATYRKKGEEKSKGYALSVCETTHEDNPFDIILKVDVSKNIESDGTILDKNIDELKDDGVNKIYADGGYDEKNLQEHCEKEGIDLVLTGMKGKERPEGKYGIEDFDIDENGINSCPCGNSPIEQVKAEDELIVKFDYNTCNACSLRDNCIAKRRKYFYEIKIKLRRLTRAIKNKTITFEDYKKAIGKRSIVESTMRQLLLLILIIYQKNAHFC